MLNIYYTTVGALQTNCYFLADTQTNNAILIDSPDDADEILEFAKVKGLTISQIILTHGHFDHIMALSEIMEKTGAPLSVFEKTERFLSDSVLNLCHYVNIDIAPVKPDKILHDGDIINFFGNKISVIHTPGHTEDSICLLCGDILIAGDTLFRFSVGRWDHPTGDMLTEIDSIKTKLMCLSDNCKVFPGHGESTTIGEERRANPYIQ